MENNILKSICSKNRFVSFANIVGSSTEEFGSNGPTIESSGTP